MLVDKNMERLETLLARPQIISDAPASEMEEYLRWCAQPIRHFSSSDVCLRLYTSEV